MDRTCKTCQAVKSIEHFYVYSGGCRRSVCKPCVGLEMKRKRAQPGYQKNVDLKHNFGITLEQYNEIATGQSLCCAICKRHQSTLSKALAVDHCHVTGQIRGLLCTNCNTAIGKLKDSPEILLQAILYLEGAKSATSLPSVGARVIGRIPAHKGK